jgi:hypothetical protein
MLCKKKYQTSVTENDVGPCMKSPSQQMTSQSFSARYVIAFLKTTLWIIPKQVAQIWSSSLLVHILLKFMIDGLRQHLTRLKQAFNPNNLQTVTLLI